MAKERRKSLGTRKLMAKPDKTLAVRHAVMAKSKTLPDNPFESIWSRRKFDILGKKAKGEERCTSLARSRAIEKRKTLLKEYEQSGKSSLFLDKRIGEHDDELKEFDKAVLRFQREHQLKLKKKGKCNLPDGEEELLSFIDDGVDDVDLSNGNKTVPGRGCLEPEMEGQNDRQKSRREVMHEIISKSKHFKAVRAMDKEEDGRLLKELDEEFICLSQSGAASSLVQSSKMVASKEQLNSNEIDDYDCLYEEIMFERRGRPSDRTKMPEEIAREEKEKLEKLEDARQKRMLREDTASDAESDDAEGPCKQKNKFVSGDDLGDSFSFDLEQPQRKGWVDEILEREEENFEEFDSESEQSEIAEDVSIDESESKAEQNKNSPVRENIIMDEWEQNDDDECDLEMTLPKKKCAVPSSKNRIIELEPENEIAVYGDKAFSGRSLAKHVFEAPKNFDQLSLLLYGHSCGEVVEIIRKIRVWNDIKLAKENRRKMQVFYGVLLQYFAVVASKKPLNLKLVNVLVKPLVEMSMETPYFAAICARHRLLRIRSQFCEAMKDQSKSSWPTLKTLLLLRLWTIVFPCSDLRHVVLTPVLILMCEYLLRCPLASEKDVAIGCFLCSMILSVVRYSRKFCPEVTIFLQMSLILALSNRSELLNHFQLQHATNLTNAKLNLCFQEYEPDIHPLEFVMVMDLPSDSLFFFSDRFRGSLISTLLGTLRGFVFAWEGFSSFPEIFLPFLDLLSRLKEQSYVPKKLHYDATAVYELIKNKIDQHHVLRRPLQMWKQKPVPIKLFNPKFEENFVKGRDYDPDRERAEMKKLKKRLKREAKGAERELRKDNAFLFGIKERDRLIQEKEKSEQYGKAKAFLQEQEHAFKSGQLGKGRKRRR